MSDNSIYKKISLISKIILIAFAIITFKVWHLGVFQKEKRLIDAIKPKRRVIVEKANRGIISDRLGTALAVNKVKYNATIYYSHIKQLPYIRYEKDKNGNNLKIFVRKEYIKKLSEILAKELDLDSERVEDLIHSKASILSHIPFVIKENISEKAYHRLKMLQRNWPGIHAEISSERYYPLKKVGSDLLGYMGRISQREYFNIADEINQLEELVDLYENKENLNSKKYLSIEEVKKRLEELKNLSYSATDLVGKAGTEKIFDEKLKGFHEKKTFIVDVKGNFLKELEKHKKPKSGLKINLTILEPLQTFAENLLLKDEKTRENASKRYNPKLKKNEALKEPWIKGGSIVVIDPNTSEILALASTPRFDPNDFIASSNQKIHQTKQKNINKWLETTSHVANIFDGKELLTKEYFSNGLKTDEKELSFEFYLDLILPKKSSIKDGLEKINNIKTAIELQENFETLLYFSKAKDAKTLLDAIFKKENNPETLEITKNLEKQKEIAKIPIRNIKTYLSNISDNRDKIFTIDLLKMIVYNVSFSDELIEKTKDISLSNYWRVSKAILRIKDQLKSQIKPLYNKIYFSNWRKINEKKFLQEKRKEETSNKKFHRPYIDFLDEKENKKFIKFWKKNSSIFITYLLKENVYEKNLMPYFNFLKGLKKEDFSTDLEIILNAIDKLDSASIFSFIKTIRSFDELDRDLLYDYPKVRKTSTKKTEKDLAKSFYPLNGFGYSKSYAISSFSPPGSIFKLLIAYTALKERYNYLINNKKSLKALNPLTIIDDIYWDSKVKKGGSIVVAKTLNNKAYPRIYKRGRLPRSSHTGIGKIDLIQAIEKSSNPYFSILASDFVENPYTLINTAKDFNIGKKTGIDLLAESPGNLPEDIIFNKTSLYSFAIGQHSLVVTPLQTAVMLSAIANRGKVFKPKLIMSTETEIQNTVLMSPEIREMILEGMSRAVSSKDGSARANIINNLKKDPKLLQEYKKLSNEFVGKTSTAEFMYNPNINPSSKAEKYNNIWFGAISFESNKNLTKKQLWQKPELVVVVQLNFGSGGKEAAALAFQIIKKYKELKEEKKIDFQNF
ncbi:MAG: Penicillin-binding protein 2 [Candidatus Anoxychlamydiales bacterium]|nr:Penicillin-binding protein 2 [Candidatus Anoxychlamydiales bacterium]